MWPCQYIDKQGVRCRAKALYRIFLVENDPFTFEDLCYTHAFSKKNTKKVEKIPDEWGKEQWTNTINTP